jgi:acyl-CoA hydrolase
MDHYKLVLPEHINHYGFLFGGHMLHWIDEFAYITATIDFPRHRFVTVAMADVEFRKRILVGEVLRFHVERLRKGRSSVNYRIRSYGMIKSDDPATVMFETTMTFVSVDEAGVAEAIRED